MFHVSTLYKVESLCLAETLHISELYYVEICVLLKRKKYSVDFIFKLALCWKLWRWWKSVFFLVKCWKLVQCWKLLPQIYVPADRFFLHNLRQKFYSPLLWLNIVLELRFLSLTTADIDFFWMIKAVHLLYGSHKSC